MIDSTSWAAIWKEAGAQGDAADLHRRLVECWSEKHRHYHTLQHLRECFEQFDALRGEMKRPSEVALALWFHDAFYDATRSDNEKRSAQWAKECALQLGLSQEAAQRVHDMVMATVDHTADAGADADPDTQWLVDIDLSILGADAARFDESNAQIRREFAHVPEDEWRVARERVLQGFLDRPRLYATERFHAMLETRARENVGRALKQLTAGT